jgi:hypothetical protein
MARLKVTKTVNEPTEKDGFASFRLKMGWLNSLIPATYGREPKGSMYQLAWLEKCL